MQLELFYIEKPKRNKDGLTKVCRYCKEELNIEYFNLRYKGFETDTNRGRDHVCRECTREAAQKVRVLKGTAPPKPLDNLCQCCGIEVESFYFDHCHETDEFRGWICRSCNVGIGFLDDSLEGVEKALAYLKRHYNE